MLSKSQREKKNTAGLICYDSEKERELHWTCCASSTLVCDSERSTELQETPLQEGSLSFHSTLVLCPQSRHRLPQHCVLHKKVQLPLPMKTHNFQHQGREKAWGYRTHRHCSVSPIFLFYIPSDATSLPTSGSWLYCCFIPCQVVQFQHSFLIYL